MSTSGRGTLFDVPQSHWESRVGIAETRVGVVYEERVFLLVSLPVSLSRERISGQGWILLLLLLLKSGENILVHEYNNKQTNKNSCNKIKRQVNDSIKMHLKNRHIYSKNGI